MKGIRQSPFPKWDCFFLGAFSLFVLVAFVHEPLFYFYCGWDGLRHNTCTSQTVADIWIGYAKSDPVYFDMPLWMALMIAFDSVLLSPFYVYSLYALSAGKVDTPFYRAIGYSVSGALIYAMVLYIVWEVMQADVYHTVLVQVIAYNIPWGIVPLLLVPTLLRCEKDWRAAGMKKYRVIQYATGGVGKQALIALADHPQLQLVGLLVHGKDKVGKDAGALAGIAPIGVTATDDIGKILAMDADCISYNALWPDVDLVCRMLESGKNVVTTSGLLYPKFFGQALVDRLEAACKKGGTSVHGTGINPGFSGEVLPLTMSALSRRIDEIYVREFADFRTYNSPELNHNLLSFGRTLEYAKANKHPKFDLMMQFFHQSIAMVADGLGVTLDRIEQTEEHGITPGGAVIESGPIPPGTIGGIKTRFAGIVRGRPMIIIQLIWVATYDMGEGWPGPKDASNHTQWSVTIEGEPSLRCTFEQASTFEDQRAAQAHTEPAMICTAMHAINAIPYVCDASPGIKTFLDLPLMAGRYALR